MIFSWPNRKKSNSLSKTLNYLGYKDEISIRFKYIGGSVIKRIIEQKSIREHSSLFIQSTLTQKKISEKEIIRYKTRELEYYLKNRYYDGEEQVNLNYITDDSKMKDLLESVTNSPWLHSSRVLNVKLKGTSTSFDKNLVLSIDLVNLIHSGLLKIDKISLKKISSKEPFDIEHASSGEQSIIMNILGISSLIKDNSLILIDEPEVCLHPEWQEKYIQLIIDVFKNQRKCHFIIATHSPQIIANLSEKNCFITSIENGICKNSKEYINQSADYQLATLFNAPGFKNEYLSRVSLSLLSKIMANKSIDNDDLNVMKTLLSVKENLSKDDPILSLIISLEEMVNYYA
ncbi:hypothetical protein A3Q29_21085 [Providencia stuartii]|uniref:ATPase AAA-type core domain-containing protein n=1 Tax=Providencia stuartii TaxID=588 RepID=A0A1S1HPM0_PROST|nr:hypothetical protein A3Q29_21085 [Providencia stuartii]